MEDPTKAPEEVPGVQGLPVGPLKLAGVWDTTGSPWLGKTLSRASSANRGTNLPVKVTGWIPALDLKDARCVIDSHGTPMAVYRVLYEDGDEEELEEHEVWESCLHKERHGEAARQGKLVKITKDHAYAGSFAVVMKDSRRWLRIQLFLTTNVFHYINVCKSMVEMIEPDAQRRASEAGQPTASKRKELSALLSTDEESREKRARGEPFAVTLECDGSSAGQEEEARSGEAQREEEDARLAARAARLDAERKTEKARSMDAIAEAAADLPQRTMQMAAQWSPCPDAMGDEFERFVRFFEAFAERSGQRIVQLDVHVTAKFEKAVAADGRVGAARRAAPDVATTTPSPRAASPSPTWPVSPESNSSGEHAEGEVAAASPAKWACDWCTYLNPPSDAICGICSNGVRAAATPLPGSS